LDGGEGEGVSGDGTPSWVRSAAASSSSLASDFADGVRIDTSLVASRIRRSSGGAVHVDSPLTHS
jgi:hypothetical protein